MSGDARRYVLVAFAHRHGGEGFGILDRVTGDVLSRVTVKAAATTLATASEAVLHDLPGWVKASEVIVHGELGPVPESMALPFEEVEVADEDGDWLRVQSEMVGDAGDVEAPSAIVGIGRAWRAHPECSAYVTAEQAPMVASAILRAAGMDPEFVDWTEAAKGGE